MKHLYILRHAKTNQFSPTGKDFDRELMEKGVKQLVELGTYFQKKLETKDLACFISTAKRTQQTWMGIKHFVRFTNETSLHSLYHANLQELLQFIWEQETSSDILLIGHNFGISDLASYFLDEALVLSTSEFIQLSFECENWNETSKGMATLTARFRPLVDVVD